MRVGYMLAKKRYAHADVLKWALQKFPEYNDVEQVIKSCYGNTSGASRKSSEGGGGGGGNGGSDNRFESVEEIRNFLDGHIRLRYNLITQRYEFLEIPEGASLSSDKPPRWQILLDRHVNSLWTKMSLTVKVNKLDMRNVIESDYTPVFNPFEDYFAHIPPWKEGDKDYIAELAATVKVKDQAQSWFHRHHPYGRRDQELSDFPGNRCQQQSPVLMTGDGGDTCFLKLSLTRAGRKNFPERPPARLRERDFRKSLSPVSPCHPEVSLIPVS